MKNTEEELQLSGFTVTKKGGAISDCVNEVRYRIQCNLPIRYPYSDANDPRLIKDKNYSVPGNIQLLFLIQSSYTKEGMGEALTRHILSVVKDAE